MYYSEAEARKLVIEAGLRLIDEKLIARTWGNISARISEDEFIITPSGRDYETLGPDDLVKVRIENLSYSGKYKPSSEKGIHASCYKYRPECSFVIHTHQFYASAICAEEKDTDFVPCAEYGFSGTKKLMKNVVSVIISHPKRNWFLMAKHGALLLGSSYENAFLLAKELEEKCKALYEEKKHNPRPGAFIDDYAQMFDKKGRANQGEDPWAVGYVRSKNVAAASYATEAAPLSRFKCFLEHYVYTKKYSKLKDK